jgi:hypothetical protein
MSFVAYDHPPHGPKKLENDESSIEALSKIDFYFGYYYYSFEAQQQI